MTDRAKWTFMVYIAGDNNLSAAGDNDLGEMRQVGSTSQVNIVAQFDNAGDLRTRRFRIERDGIDERVVDLDETDSGSPDVLLEFIGWAAEEYPAERYALVLWNHGSGWQPEEMDRVARSVDAVDYNEREVSERASSQLRRVFFRTSLEEIFRLPTRSERAICSDDLTGHSLDTIELERVMAATVELLGRKVDLLGMDACLMNNYEVAYQMRPFAHCFVASEENEPNDGWPYDRLLARLVGDPEMATADLARGIVEDYLASYLDRGYAGDVAQCALDLGRVDALAPQLDALAQALHGHMPEAAAEIWQAQLRSARFCHNTLWDVQYLCLELEAATASDSVGRAAAAVREALAVGADRAVLAEAHSGPKVAECGGVSIYCVPPLVPISRYYGELAFARDGDWLNMLEAYHSI